MQRSLLQIQISSTKVNFKGTTGFANFVGALQTIARQYAKSGVTVGTRMMGYNGQTLTITDTSAFDGTSTTAPSTTTGVYPTTGTGEEYLGGVTGDYLYVKDEQLVSNVYKSDAETYGSNGLKSNQDYWISSRAYLYHYETLYGFLGRYVGQPFGIDDAFIFGEDAELKGAMRLYFDGWTDYSNGKGVRPIITLKSGIITSDGSGTKESPYELTQEVEKHTVNVVTMNGIVEGDTTKEVENDKTTTFTVNPSEGYGNGEVSCSNNQTATLSDNTLTTGKITGDTTCTVTFSQVWAENVSYNPPEGLEEYDDVQSMIDYLTGVMS